MSFFSKSKIIFFNLLLGFLSYLVPKNKRQILLGSNSGNSFFGNSKFFYLYLISKKKNFFDRIFWITKNRRIYSELKTKKMPVLYLYSLRGFIAILRSNFLITSDTVKDVSYQSILFGRYKKIHTAHGLPLKGLIPNLRNISPSPVGYYLFRKERLSYKVYVVSSEATKKYSKENFEYYKNFEILGYPRNDVFFNKEYVYEEYERKFNLKNYAKVLLYCPTFRDVPTPIVPFTSEFLLVLNEYLSKNNFIFLFKQHPDKSRMFKIDEFSNIIDISQKVEDIQDLLIHVDVLITDYSSSCLDFALLNKPIIFYPYDFFEYSKMRPFKIDYFRVLPGPFAKNQDDLLELLKSNERFFLEKGYKEKFEEFTNRFHKFKDGKSSDRLYDYIIRS